MIEEVRDFLSNSGLIMYFDSFIDQGFDEMSVIVEMDQEHLQMVGVKPGHVIKFKKCLNQWIEDQKQQEMKDRELRNDQKNETLPDIEVMSNTSHSKFIIKKDNMLEQWPEKEPLQKLKIDSLSLSSTKINPVMTTSTTPSL